MSSFDSTPQISPEGAVRAILASPSKLVICAAGCMMFTLFMPAVYISVTAMGTHTGSSPSGTQLAGSVAWLCFIVFVVAAASRFVTALFPYRKLSDMAAFAMVGITFIYAAFGGPVASEMHQVASEMHQVGQFDGLLGSDAISQIASVSVIPNIGAILFFIAPLALFQARRRERTPS